MHDIKQRTNTNITICWCQCKCLILRIQPHFKLHRYTFKIYGVSPIGTGSIVQTLPVTPKRIRSGGDMFDRSLSSRSPTHNAKVPVPFQLIKNACWTPQLGADLCTGGVRRWRLLCQGEPLVLVGVAKAEFHKGPWKRVQMGKNPYTWCISLAR